MGNVQVHAAVGAQVASQLITIPPPLFRSSQREVAAHLLPAHTSRLLLPSAARTSARSPGSGGDGVIGDQAGLVESKGCGSAEVGRR
jgi:hypothetical protein